MMAAFAAFLSSYGKDNVPSGSTQPPATSQHLGNPHPLKRRYFSNAITSATSDLPLSVIKELRSGFKNYIPLALCTHKPCSNTTCSTEGVDTEIAWNDKGEMRLKQKAMTAGKDHYITTDDFTEIRKNFIRGMHKYLIMGDDTGPGGDRATDCAEGFREFFSTIAARPDYTLDWPSYRGYIIETYTSWVGRRGDEYGLIFDEQLFYKYKMRNLVPSIMEQLRHSNNRSSGSANAVGRGRGRGSYSGSGSSFGQGGTPFSPSSRTNQSSNTFRCYLCGEPHSHKEHQGDARRLVLNEHGKWVDKSLGNRIVCIAFNIGIYGCRRRAACIYSHTCSLCGNINHGCTKCNT